MGPPVALHREYAGFGSLPSIVNNLEQQTAATPAPTMMTVTSAEQTSQPMVVPVRADQRPANVAGLPSDRACRSRNRGGGTQARAGGQSHARRPSFFGHGAGEQVAHGS